MVSAAAVLVGFIAYLYILNDLWMLGGHIISAVDHTKQAASHTVEAKESFQNMYHDSQHFRKHAGSAIQNSGEAVKHVVKVAVHSKEAISRGHIIWKKSQMLYKVSNVIYYLMDTKDSNKQKLMT